MRDKEIKVTLQRTTVIACLPSDRYQITRITNSLFVQTEIGSDGKRRGSMHEPELRFYVGDLVMTRQAEDIANRYESTVIPEGSR
jgi:hypothetical protein